MDGGFMKLAQRASSYPMMHPCWVHSECIVMVQVVVRGKQVGWFWRGLQSTISSLSGPEKLWHCTAYGTVSHENPRRPGSCGAAAVPNNAVLDERRPSPSANTDRVQAWMHRILCG